MITMATYGVGMWVGTLLSGYVKDKYTIDNIVQWKSIWLVPAGIAFAVLILFTLFFKDNRKSAVHDLNADLYIHSAINEGTTVQLTLEL